MEELSVHLWRKKSLATLTNAKVIYYYFCDLLHFTIIASGNSSPHTGPIIGSIAGVLVFSIIGAVIGFLVCRKSCKTKKEEKRSDINPEYGTYEASDPPVSEVIENRDAKFYLTNSIFAGYGPKHGLWHGVRRPGDVKDH